MSDVFFQIVVEMCTLPVQVVVDISAFTRASARACKASSCHFFGFENDQDIFDILLKPLCDSRNEDLLVDDAYEDLRASKDDWNN